MRNILVREPGRPASVYARCAECGKFVALYELSDYYHHGKGVESYLRSHGSAAAESGRDALGSFERAKEKALAGFEAAVEHLEEEGKAI